MNWTKKFRLDLAHFGTCLSAIGCLSFRFKRDGTTIASNWIIPRSQRAQIPTLGLRRGQGGRDHIQVALAWEDKEDL